MAATSSSRPTSTRPAKLETEQSTLGIYLAKTPPKKLVSGILTADFALNIPPGAKDYIARDSFVVPIAVHAISIQPHAHLLCKEMKVTATLPSGKVKPLIWIKDWDWNWQGAYQYAQPVPLPAGTRVDMVYTYDNSTDNLHNPNNPPRAVHFGEQTKDEMALCGLEVVADNASAQEPTSEASPRLPSGFKFLRRSSGVPAHERRRASLLTAHYAPDSQKRSAAPSMARRFFVFQISLCSAPAIWSRQRCLTWTLSVHSIADTFNSQVQQAFDSTDHRRRSYPGRPSPSDCLRLQSLLRSYPDAERRTRASNGTVSCCRNLTAIAESRHGKNNRSARRHISRAMPMPSRTKLSVEYAAKSSPDHSRGPGAVLPR